MVEHDTAVPTMFGMDELQAHGFIMRMVRRTSATPAYEVESVVTKIAEEPAPAGAFDIPVDYKEVVSPATGRLGGLPR